MAKQFAHYARRFSTCTSSITIRMPRFSHQFASAGSQAQKLRQLGVKPSKSLAPALVDGAYESDELPFVLEEDATRTPQKNANGRQLGDLTEL
jgi:hypothetical protein